MHSPYTTAASSPSPHSAPAASASSSSAPSMIAPSSPTVSFTGRWITTSTLPSSHQSADKSWPHFILSILKLDKRLKPIESNDIVSIEHTSEILTVTHETTNGAVTSLTLILDGRPHTYHTGADGGATAAASSSSTSSSSVSASSLTITACQLPASEGHDLQIKIEFPPIEASNSTVKKFTSFTAEQIARNRTGYILERSHRTRDTMIQVVSYHRAPDGMKDAVVEKLDTTMLPVVYSITRTYNAANPLPLRNGVDINTPTLLSRQNSSTMLMRKEISSPSTPFDENAFQPSSPIPMRPNPVTFLQHSPQHHQQLLLPSSSLPSARVSPALTPSNRESPTIQPILATTPTQSSSQSSPIVASAAQSYQPLSSSSASSAASSPSSAPLPVPCCSLTGTWKVDKSRSQSLEDMMKALGVPWLARKVVAQLDVTTDILHEPLKQEITITDTSSAGIQTTKLHLKGEVEDIVNKEGKVIKMKSKEMDMIRGAIGLPALTHSPFPPSVSSVPFTLPSYLPPPFTTSLSHRMHPLPGGAIYVHSILPDLKEAEMQDVRVLIDRTKMIQQTWVIISQAVKSTTVRYFDLQETPEEKKEGEAQWNLMMEQWKKLQEESVASQQRQQQQQTPNPSSNGSGLAHGLLRARASSAGRTGSALDRAASDGTLRPPTFTPLSASVPATPPPFLLALHPSASPSPQLNGNGHGASNGSRSSTPVYGRPNTPGFSPTSYPNSPVLSPPSATLPPPNLSGVWHVLKDRSNDLSVLLKRMGIPWIYRTFANTLDIKTTITQNEKEITLMDTSIFGSHTQVFHLNGKWYPVTQYGKGKQGLARVTSDASKQSLTIETVYFKPKTGGEKFISQVEKIPPPVLRTTSLPIPAQRNGPSISPLKLSRSILEDSQHHRVDESTDTTPGSSPGGSSSLLTTESLHSHNHLGFPSSSRNVSGSSHSHYNHNESLVRDDTQSPSEFERPSSRTSMHMHTRHEETSFTTFARAYSEPGNEAKERGEYGSSSNAISVSFSRPSTPPIRIPMRLHIDAATARDDSPTPPASALERVSSSMSNYSDYGGTSQRTPILATTPNMPTPVATPQLTSNRTSPTLLGTSNGSHSSDLPPLRPSSAGPASSSRVSKKPRQIASSRVLDIRILEPDGIMKQMITYLEYETVVCVCSRVYKRERTDAEKEEDARKEVEAKERERRKNESKLEELRRVEEMTKSSNNKAVQQQRVSVPPSPAVVPILAPHPSSAASVVMPHMDSLPSSAAAAIQRSAPVSVAVTPVSVILPPDEAALISPPVPLLPSALPPQPLLVASSNGTPALLLTPPRAILLLLLAISIATGNSTLILLVSIAAATYAMQQYFEHKSAATQPTSYPHHHASSSSISLQPRPSSSSSSVARAPPTIPLGGGLTVEVVPLRRNGT